MTEKSDTLESLVADMVRSRLGDVNVVDVKVEEEITFEDDTILRVYVIYQNKENRLDAEKVSGFLRWLRPALRDHGERRFPVMSFISKNEVKGDLAGAA
jgi:hypothetical protein